MFQYIELPRKGILQSGRFGVRCWVIAGVTSSPAKPTTEIGSTILTTLVLPDCHRRPESHCVMASGIFSRHFQSVVSGLDAALPYSKTFRLSRRAQIDTMHHSRRRHSPAVSDKLLMALRYICLQNGDSCASIYGRVSLSSSLEPGFSLKLQRIV